MEETISKELVKNVSDQAWLELAKTSTETFKSIMSPITSTTSGIGRLIDAKFDGLVEAEKILVTENIKKANKKSKKKTKDLKPNPSTIIKIIDASKNEVDINLRELWSNLIANEMVDRSVHPHFIDILQKLSPEDAVILLKIGENTSKKQIKELANTLLNIMTLSLPTLVFAEENNLNTDILNKHGLIYKTNGVWHLTHLGEGFLSAVVDPNSKI